MKHKLALFAIVTAAALLRFGGLSHDLHEGRIYHPDTPKQVRAVERFLEGRYFLHTGISDYDGYPYFNAHLVEYLCRILNPPRVAVLNLLGIPTRLETPDVMALFWITRLFNAFVATLLVWLVHRMTREHYGNAAALVAALFLALSPVDVTACHYANGDTTAAFFATLSLLFALRIARDGRWRDYFLAVFFAACGFAAKYHAGIAALPIVLAHRARYPTLRAFFSRASWIRLLACLAIGIGALFLTIPTLIHHTGQVTQDIAYFFTHVSKGRRLPEGIRGTGITGKFLYSMHRNGPILLYLLGPVAAVAALLATIRLGWRDIRIGIIASLPVVYFLVGVSFRPIAPPVYHTLMTPMVFMLAAIFLTRRAPETARPFLRRSWAVGAILAVLLSTAYLARQSLKEAFFLWHMDTRRMASHWVAENVPDSFFLNRGLYTFQRNAPSATPAGTVFARSSIHPQAPPEKFQPLKAFTLERASLMQFRNPDILTHIGASSWITSPTRMPVSQRWPSETGNQFLFDNGLDFLRDGKRLALEPNRTLTRRLVSKEPLEDAFVTIRNGPLPNFVEVSFGGESRTFRLAPGVTEAIRIRNPKTCFPRERGLHCYRLSAGAASGPALVRLATRHDEIGAALFDAGRHAESASWLEDAAVTTRNPTLAVQALAGRLIGAQPPPRKPAVNPADLAAVAGRIQNVFNAASLEDTYGIGPRYLDTIPFLSITNEALIRKGFRKKSRLQAAMEEDEETDVRIHEPDPARKTYVATRPLMLDPGYYTCAIRFRYAPVPEQTPTLTVIFALPDGTEISSRTLDISDCPAGKLVERRVKAHIPSGTAAAGITVIPSAVAGLTVDRITISPDILATVQGWKTILTLIQGGPAVDAADEPMAFDVLLALGDRAAASNATAQALEYYTAAGRTRPDNHLPAMRLASLRKEPVPPPAWKEIPIGARFRNGLLLESARLRETGTSAGGSLGMNLYWDVENPLSDWDNTMVWVHFVDSSGAIAFQGDHDLRHDLLLNRSTSLANPGFTEIPVPKSVRPGVYRIRIGLYLPLSRERIGIAGSRFTERRTSVDLAETVTVR